MNTRHIIAFILLTSCANAQGFPRIPSVPKDLRQLLPKKEEAEDAKPSAPQSQQEEARKLEENLKPEAAPKPTEPPKQDETTKQPDQKQEPATPVTTSHEQSEPATPEKPLIKAYRGLNFRDPDHDIRKEDNNGKVTYRNIIAVKLREIIGEGRVERIDDINILYNSLRDELLELDSDYRPIQHTANKSNIIEYIYPFMEGQVNGWSGKNDITNIHCITLRNKGLAIVRVEFKKANSETVLKSLQSRYPDAKIIKTRKEIGGDRFNLPGFDIEVTTTQMISNTPEARTVLALPGVNIAIKSKGVGSLGEKLAVWQGYTKQYNSSENKSISTDEFMEGFAQEVTSLANGNSGQSEHAAFTAAVGSRNMLELFLDMNSIGKAAGKFPLLTISSHDILAPRRKALVEYVQKQEQEALDAQRKKEALEKAALEF